MGGDWDDLFNLYVQPGDPCSAQCSLKGAGMCFSMFPRSHMDSHTFSDGTWTL